MEVIIKGEPKYLYVQTITLQPEEGNTLYAFHCPACGNSIQKIGGKVGKIYPFYEPSEQVPAIAKCVTCKHEYTFQTHSGYSTHNVKVILHAEENREKNYFFCYRGKGLILEYTKDSIYSHVEQKKKTIPFITRCSNANCLLVYSISDII